jgi:hypothetical protein
MRPQRIEPEQRPVAAIEGFRSFTAKQGQDLAFIYYYTKIHGTPPAEADFQRSIPPRAEWKNQNGKFGF